MSLTDRYGLPVTAASRAAVDVYDRGVRALLGFGADAIGAFREALGLDPDNREHTRMIDRKSLAPAGA